MYLMIEEILMASQYNVDGAVVKKPGNDRPLTKKQKELWMRYADDPMAFFTEQCYVRGSRGKVLFQPRIYQEELLDSVLNNNHVIATSPRQSGKCVTERERVDVKIGGVEYNVSLGELHKYISGRTGLDSFK